VLWWVIYVIAVYVNFWSWHVHDSHSVYLPKPDVIGVVTVHDPNAHSQKVRCDILALGDGDILVWDLIELIVYSYQQGAYSFSETYVERTTKLSVLGLEQFGMGGRLGSFLGCTWVRTKCAQRTHVGVWGRYMILESCQELVPPVREWTGCYKWYQSQDITLGPLNNVSSKMNRNMALS
jgi:hypothetical protein